MKWRIVILALACFGAGLLMGFVIFHKSSAVQRHSSAVVADVSDRRTHPPTRNNVGLMATSNEATNTASTENSTNQISAVSDLQHAVHDARSMWDLSGIFRAIDGLNTNQFGEALAACFKTTNLQTVAYAIRELGARWGRIDPQKALAFAQAWQNASERSLIIAGILTGWAEKKPEEATAYANSLPDGQGKSQALAAVAGTIAFDNPQAAFDLVKNLTPGYLRANLTFPLFSQWASRSPSDAAAAALKFPESYQAVGVVANVWAVKDFDAAYAWAASLPSGGIRDEAIKRAMWTLASGDFDEATTWIGKHLADPGANEAAYNLANTLADVKPADTVNWIRSLPEGPVKIAAINGGFRNLSYYDPASTADLLSTVPASNERDSQHQILASTWARLDLAGANKWVDGLPAGQLRDQVARPIADETAKTDPAAAARLVDTIQDNRIWQDAAAQVAARWFKIDPDAAKKWVAQSQLSEEFKNNFAKQKP